MPKKLVPAVFCLGLLALSTLTAYAQGSPEVIVRQGDTIEWVAMGPPPHKVRFGANGATPLDAINGLLENFTPALTVGPGGEGDSPAQGQSAGTLLTAKVKDNADVVGKAFVFVCGVHSAGQMVSLPFRIEAKVAGEAPRKHKIMGGPGLHWHLHVDTTP
jgi:plastocyanin